MYHGVYLIFKKLGLYEISDFLLIIQSSVPILICLFGQWTLVSVCTLTAVCPHSSIYHKYDESYVQFVPQ